MFIFRTRTPVMFDADEGGGGGAVAPGADPSLGSPSPDEQTFESPGDYRNARSAFLREAPPILSTEEPTAPVVEPDPIDAAVDDLTTPTAPPAGVTPPAAPIADPYAEFGGRQQVETAAQVMAALRTESGVRAMIAQGLVALGYTPAQIAAFTQQQATPGTPEAAPTAPAATDALASIADDDLVTGAELKKLVGQLVTQAATQAAQVAAEAVQTQVDPVRQAFEQQQQRAAQVTADATYVELLGPVPPDTEVEAKRAWLQQAHQVQVYATAHLDPNNWNPADIRAALIRGHAQFVSEQDALLKAYAASKKRDRAAQPTNVGGGAPQGAEQPPEPQSLSEARAALKAEGFFR